MASVSRYTYHTIDSAREMLGGVERALTAARMELQQMGEPHTVAEKVAASRQREKIALLVQRKVITEDHLRRALEAGR